MSAAPAPATFSEHWHRVAGQRLSLRPTVRATRQTFRGEKWFVLHDPFNTEYFRVSRAAYDFMARLAPERTVEEVWEACIAADPDHAPGQEEVLQLLAQLYRANLLRGALPPDSASLFERQQKRRRLERRSTLANFMFAQFPLFDPDDFLQALLPWVSPLLGRAGAVLWLLAMLLAGRVMLEHWTDLWRQSEGLLAPENLLLLYAGIFLVKALHEMGHALACRRLGGAVHRMGFMLMIFTPLPFVDATASWGFASRWERILVAAAGMIVELFVAAIALLVWAGTGPGAWHSLAYNILFAASVTTLLFNGNPLLRYDGYYILSDLLGIPNLGSRSWEMLRYLAERRLFGCAGLESPALGRGEAALLVAYGIASGIYRAVVFGAIIWFVSGKFLLLGLVLAAVFFVKAFILPVGRFIGYLAQSRRLEKVRTRAAGVTLGMVAAAVLLLGVVPFPQHFTAPGVLQAERCTELFASAAGRVVAQSAASGERVAAGQPLLRLENEELGFDLAAAQAERRQAVAERDRALDHSSGELQPITARIETIDRQIADLGRQIDALVVAAPHDGVWVYPESADAVGRWLRRGALAGRLIDARRFEFSAVISQDDAAALFTREIRGAEIRLPGQAGTVLAARDWRVTPGEQDVLPSPALGWPGGGTIQLQAGDRTGVRAANSFYEVRANVSPEPGAALLHGRMGQIRFRLPPSPLLVQWARRLTQMVQSRPAP